ncbi:unnamed protein product [Acanthoscelides obtectus]|nr:unnamed protein product [Acanthoscelides obtectus]CAK1623950.1 hypothetical protein AOBTE_LOCUS2249 [Acanthoscelides obtectus]
MVQQCYLCKIYKHQAGAESLKFNSTRKGEKGGCRPLDSRKSINFLRGLCSKRFGENAFVYGSEGQKTLKRDVIPLISHSLFDPAVSTSSESSVSPEKQEDSDCSTISAISITCEGTPAKKRRDSNSRPGRPADQ